MKADYAAVIFDMDGLVLETESTYRIAWQQAAMAMGYDFTAEFCLSLSGLHYQAIEFRLIEFFGADFNFDTFNQLSGEYWHKHVRANGITIKHGFFEVLNRLNQQKTPFCLATNSGSVNAQECLYLAGIIDVFSLMVTRDDVEQGKPEPEIFLKAAQLLQVAISQCLVLEDSHAGIVAASRAGAISVFIPSTVPVDPLTIEICDFMVSDLAELANTLLGKNNHPLKRTVV